MRPANGAKDFLINVAAMHDRLLLDSSAFTLTSFGETAGLDRADQYECGAYVTIVGQYVSPAVRFPSEIGP